MSSYSTIVWLLPIVFMVHDFEEILFFKSWINKNRDYLSEKFPNLSKRFLRLSSLSTSAFALAVAEEFALLSLITVGSVIFESYVLWLAAFMGFFVHLLLHLGQWIILRRYIPAIGTTFPALLYCAYTLHEIIAKSLFQPSEIILWTIVGIVLVGANLILAHRLAAMFSKKEKTWRNAKL